jgi:hypothetical protein
MKKTHYNNFGYSLCGRNIRPKYDLWWSWCWGSVDCKMCIKRRENEEK